MKRFLVVRLTIIYLIIFISGCKVTQTQKPIPITPLFQDSLKSYPAYVEITSPPVSRIQKEDLLGVTVSSLNKESNEILNFSNVNSLSLSNLPGGGGGGQQPIGYPVDSSGYISMAFVGKVKVEGLTLEQAQETIREALNKTIKDPAVNIRFMNHKYTVMGEVKSVGAFNLLDDRTTILDAIASAGDLTEFANRDSITVIRAMGIGRREIGKVNLLNRDVFKSPYFYIRNGDVVYIDPIKEKQVTIPVTDDRFRRLQAIQTSIAILSSVVGLVAILVSVFK